MANDHFQWPLLIYRHSIQLTPKSRMKHITNQSNRTLTRQLIEDVIASKMKEGFVVNDKYDFKPTRRNPWVSTGVVIFILILLELVVTFLPKSFKMTHDQIGTGLPALVFVYDPNLVVSISQTEQMDKAYNQLSGQVFFLSPKLRLQRETSLLLNTKPTLRSFYSSTHLVSSLKDNLL
jgi:hypothetical protein